MPTMASDNVLPDTIDGKPRPPNVSAFFAESTDTGDYDNRWGRLWRARWTPWDRGGPSMPLHDILVDRRDLFPSPLAGKKALVPGAGRGHDVLLLASFGFDAYGLDLSPEASAAAKENEEKNGSLRIYEAKEGQRGSVAWLTGDFFSWDFSGIGKFDLIFDYTFLCALPPELRPEWSRAMARNLAPNGRLVCLEFPTTKPTDSGGPPFALPEAVYDAILGRPGQEIPYDEKKAVDLERLGPKSHDALERLAHIIPKRSHADGYDEKGNMIDRISVWTHRSSQAKA